MKQRTMLIILVAQATWVQASTHFQGIGDLPGGGFRSYAFGVSGDGSTVVGTSWSSSGWEAFRWSFTGGMTGLGDLFGGAFYSEAGGASYDGTVVVGWSDAGTGREAFRWVEGVGITGLGFLATNATVTKVSSAHGVSADGTVVVGQSRTDGNVVEAYRWTPGGGMVSLGAVTANSGEGRGTSADGTVLTGRASSLGTAFIWTPTGGVVSLGDLPGGSASSNGRAVSADGSTIVGVSSSTAGEQAFLWTAATNMLGLGDLPGGYFSSYAQDVSGDGSIVVGLSSGGFPDREAFIWDAVNGMRPLKTVLIDSGNTDVIGWTLDAAFGISDDGLTIVGIGKNTSGIDEGWIATLPPPPPTSVNILGLQPGTQLVLTCTGNPSLDPQPAYSTNLLVDPPTWIPITSYTNSHDQGTNTVVFDNPAPAIPSLTFQIQDGGD